MVKATTAVPWLLLGGVADDKERPVAEVDPALPEKAIVVGRNASKLTRSAPTPSDSASHLRTASPEFRSVPKEVPTTTRDPCTTVTDVALLVFAKASAISPVAVVVDEVAAWPATPAVHGVVAGQTVVKASR